MRACPSAEALGYSRWSLRDKSQGTQPIVRFLCTLRRYRCWLARAVALLVLGFCLAGFAQAPDVPIYRQGRRESQYEGKIATVSKELFASTNVIKLEQVKEQLKRTSCQVSLPAPGTRKLSVQEICVQGRRSHLRVGWAYTCTKCEQWHVNLAGGYALTTNGVVATCYHVVKPGREIKDGCLVAADDAERVFPVTEILAANRYSDACLLQVAGQGFRPLPLNTNVCPGDPAYCYSDPLDHRGYFSSGIVNRFYQFPGRRPVSSAPSATYAPTRVNVSTDWAPGSSGSAVLDEFANAIGHVSTISTLSGQEESADGESHVTGPTMIIFHDAVSARDVLRLIERPSP